MEMQRRTAVKKDARMSSSRSENVNFRGGAEAMIPEHPQLQQQISVVFNRDEARGYGLTVYGDNPVFVQSVTENGPADKAGLKNGDLIFKVNGKLVSSSNHVDVVDLIKRETCVAMTVIRGPVNFLTTPVEHNPSYECQEDPNDKELGVDILLRRYEGQVRFVQELCKELDGTESNERLQTDLVQGIKYVRLLESQLNKLGSKITPANFAKTTTEEAKNGPKNSQPPTPPPIERIPRHQDDSGLRGSRSLAATGSHLNRRRSNPEHQHLGINKVLHLAEGSNNSVVTFEQSALSRSTSTASVGAGKLDRQSSIPDELPPALPAKRRIDPTNFRNSSLHDIHDFAAPSGTPPPPYGADILRNQRVPKSGSFNGLSVAGHRVQSSRQQMDVMTAEDSQFNISHGPFNDFAVLQKSLPHLAVFLNFLLTSNNDDSVALLFHLITDIYAKGSNKEMQRWAFEIHSTFIVPGSPLDLLRCISCDCNLVSIVSEIDEALGKPDGHDAALRVVFDPPRRIALEAIKMRLQEFQQKRQLGLSTVYGPFTDTELKEASHSAEKTRDIVDTLLSRHLETITNADGCEDPENRSDRQAALGCALATFLKANGIKAMGRDGCYLVDKWPLFVQKDKSKFKLKDKSKKSVNLLGHQFSRCHARR